MAESNHLLLLRPPPGEEKKCLQGAGQTMLSQVSNNLIYFLFPYNSTNVKDETIFRPGFSFFCENSRWAWREILDFLSVGEASPIFKRERVSCSSSLTSPFVFVESRMRRRRRRLLCTVCPSRPLLHLVFKRPRRKRREKRPTR